MVHGRLLLLVLMAPLLCGTSLVEPGPLPDLGLEPTPFPQEEVETYIYQITAAIEIRIEEIAKTLPPADVEKLRKEHYAWKLRRDLECAEKARNGVDPRLFLELDCLAMSSTEYLADELKVTDVEEFVRKIDPATRNTPPD